MTNTYPNNNADHVQLTTKTLGVAEAKAKDLCGYILSTAEVSDATTKILVALGIPLEAIRCVKVGGTDNGNVKIIAELWKFLLPKKEKEKVVKSSLFDFSDESDNNDGELPKEFFLALRNKAYAGKHLEVSHVTRTYKKNEKKCLRMEFDAEILIAFIYDIPFLDKYYRIKARLFPDLPENFNSLSKKDRNKIKEKAAENKKYGIHNCEIITTFSTNVFIENEQGEKVQIKGFSPDQVELFYKSNK